MDTPERSQINIAKFEDSPVFKFINNLSPIKPIRPSDISQTINSLNFASHSSVFTSPELIPHKEYRFLRRHQLPDPSKPEFSSDGDRNGVDEANNLNACVTMNSDEQKENVDPRCENISELSYVCSKNLVDLAGNINRESGFVNSSLSSLKEKHVAEYACTSSECGQSVEEQRSVNISEANLGGLGNIDQNHWDSLIADASDLLMFQSPNAEPYNESVDPATTFYRSIRNAIQNEQSHGAVVCGERVRKGNESENLPHLSKKGTGMIENSANVSFLNSTQNMDYENLSGLCRGERRRCLVYEMAGGRKKHPEDVLPSESSLLLASEDNASTNKKQIVETNVENDISHLLPRIGLHLNALSTTPNDFKIVNHESSGSGRVLVGTSSSANFCSPNSSKDLFCNVLIEYSLERDIDIFESGRLLVEDQSHESGYTANEDINPNSPKKKRRRLEQGGDGKSCKRCNCKKSECLKLYCECFAAGVYCEEPCVCIGCFNKPIHVDTVLAKRKQIELRNPNAFAPKVIRRSDIPSEIGDDFTNTPASARHKRGCNCKKSGCHKKYCECYQGGVGCSTNCRCEGCKNAFGRKDGSSTSCTDPECEEEVNETTQKAALDRSLYKAAMHDDLEQCMDSAPPATPLGTRRQPYNSFSKKRPSRARATIPSISAYSGLSASQGFGKSSLFSSLPKFTPHFETVVENEMPYFLQGRGSHTPISGIKISSPSKKRVSPPKNWETSSSLRSSRKLILQSIPSFPSLTQNQ